MPKGVSVPAEVKERALVLYLQERPVTEITKILAVEFPEDAVKEEALRDWVVLYKWKEKRDDVKAAALQQITEERVIDIHALTKQQLAAYKLVREKGQDALGAEDLPFKKALDAAMAIDIGAKGERKIVMGLVAVSFVQDVIQVLTEEIEDPNVLRRIAGRLKRLVVQAQDT
mgnify:FL=1